MKPFNIINWTWIIIIALGVQSSCTIVYSTSDSLFHEQFLHHWSLFFLYQGILLHICMLFSQVHFWIIFLINCKSTNFIFVLFFSLHFSVPLNFILWHNLKIRFHYLSLLHIVKLQVRSQVQVKVLVRVLVKVHCPVHGLDPGRNSGAQNSVSNSQKKGPGETL